MNQAHIGRFTRHPVAISGFAGLLAGLAAAGALTASGYPWYSSSDPGRFWFLGWLDFPIGSLIERHWTGGGGSGSWLLSTGLNGLFWGAGGMALARGMRRSARLRRIIVRAIVLETALLAALLATGIPSPASSDLPAAALTYAHLPAFALLAQVGLCCGSADRFIVSDFWGELLQHPTALALALLLISNVVMFVLLAYAGTALRQGITRRRDRTRRTAPVAPG